MKQTPQLSQLTCIFCDIAGNDVVIEENGYVGIRCPRCCLIYTSPRPALNEIKDLYGHDEAHVSAGSHIAAEAIKRLYARHHLKVMAPFLNNGSILDVGAGAGFFLDEARRAGMEPFALEFNPMQAEFIRNALGIPCEEAPLGEGVFGGKRFDVVYHCDVISHFVDPVADLRATHSLLKEGGILAFETGNLPEVDRKYYRFFSRFQYPDHLFFFSVENLRQLLEKTGFDLLAVHRYSILPQLVALNVLAKVKRMAARKVAGARQTPTSSPAAAGDGDGSARSEVEITGGRENRGRWVCLI